MNVLILGSGGREHALAWKAAQSQRLEKLYCAPGSSAIAALAECAAIDVLEPACVVDFCAKKRIDLVIVGPEGPLAAGLADAVREAGVEVFGPGKAAAQLESSKTFAKGFMARHGIPTARWESFDDPGKARAAAEARRLPLVVKADGLAAGKGVRVCRSVNEALGAVTEFMERGALGEAGRAVVIEDCLEGPEVSVMALCDGKSLCLLPSSRDHKRLMDGDEGPNTGGMGAFAPVVMDEPTLDRVKAEVLDRAMAGLSAEGLDYRGLLYAGLMMTPQGPKVLEFNCRFGDPEAQAVLPLLRSDLLELASACAAGKLEGAAVETMPGACVSLTLASEGYPERPLAGRVIEGLDEKLPPGVHIFHAGTVKKGGVWTTAGGRVLGVTARAAGLEEAREKAYAAAARIRFEGRQLRTDIGGRALALK